MHKKWEMMSRSQLEELIVITQIKIIKRPPILWNKIVSQEYSNIESLIKFIGERRKIRQMLSRSSIHLINKITFY